MEQSQIPRCPYSGCQAILPKMPSRKTKCPSCGQFIYFKYTPENREQRLMTEEQAAAAEQEWNRKYKIEKMVQTLTLFGSSHELLLQEEQRSSSLEVAYLMLLADVLTQPQRSWHDRYMAHFSIARQLSELGQDWTKNEKEGYFCKLKELESSFKEYWLEGKKPVVEITYPDHACEECKKLHRTKHQVEVLLQQMPLPNLSCTKMKTGMSSRIACNGNYQLWLDEWASK